MSTAHTDLLGNASPFQVLDSRLAHDVRASIRGALAAGAVFEFGNTPTQVFRHALEASIASIRGDPRGKLLQRLLIEGPYENSGPIPSSLAASRLTDDEVASATAFVFSSMVNAFQGRLAELLAALPICELVHDMQQARILPRTASLYFGDAVTALRPNGRGRAKAADLHILSSDHRRKGKAKVQVLGFGEVKSYHASVSRIRRQLSKHLDRSRLGLVIGDELRDSNCIEIARSPRLFWVEPDRWKLPRGFHFEMIDGRSVLHNDTPNRPRQKYAVTDVGDGLHRVTLGWSREALAASAYSMTFWYMERVGETIFQGTCENPWPEMSPSEAGCNAATSALYYAILRARNARESNRAIALYNMYGFGYALGMNFVDAKGTRHMLWAEDLREIAKHGVSRDGFRIAQ